MAAKVPAAAAVRAGDNLKKMPIRVFEIDAAAAVVVIRLTRLPLPWVSPEGKLPVAHSIENCVEFSVADQEG